MRTQIKWRSTYQPQILHNFVCCVKRNLQLENNEVHFEWRGNSCVFNVVNFLFVCFIAIFHLICLVLWMQLNWAEMEVVPSLGVRIKWNERNKEEKLCITYDFGVVDIEFGTSVQWKFTLPPIILNRQLNKIQHCVNFLFGCCASNIHTCNINISMDCLALCTLVKRHPSNTFRTYGLVCRAGIVQLAFYLKLPF